MIAWRRTLLLKASRVVGRQIEAILSERVTIHLTEIVVNRPRARIGVLELQDRLIGFPRGSADLDGATVRACVQVGLSIGASVGRERGFSGAVCRGLAAGIEVNGEVTLVEYSGLACRVLGGVRGSDAIFAAR